MSNSELLTAEWNEIHEAASKAELAAIPDPRLGGTRAFRKINSPKHRRNKLSTPHSLC
jgi:hypothetical protein